MSHSGTIAALLLLTCSHLNAQSVVWQTLAEPFGGCVDAFVVAPDGAIYAHAFREGTVRSTDDGATWSAHNVGGNSFVLMITRRGTMFVYDYWDGVVSRGATALAIGLPLTSKPLYETSSGVIIMSGSSGLLRSSDDGETWARVGPDSTSFRFAAAGPGNLIFAVSDTSGLYRSSDEGTTWTPVGDRSGSGAKALISLASGDIIVSGSQGIYRSTDLGGSFTRIALENVNTREHGMALLPSGDLLVATHGGLFRVDPRTGDTEPITSVHWKELLGVAVTTSGTSLIGYCGRGILRSTDDATTFSAVGVASAWPVTDLVEAPDESVYVGVTGHDIGMGDNAVYRSTDRGLSWTDVRFHEEPPYRIVISQSGAIHIVGKWSVFRSIDDGATWQKTQISTMTFYGDLIATQTGELVLTTDRGIMRSTDDGITWNLVLERGSVGGISESPDGVLRALSSGEILSSSDRGATWTTTPLTAPPILYGSWSQLETPDDRTFILTSHNALPEIARSTDAGATWDTTTFTCNRGWFQLFDERDRGMYIASQCGIFMSRDHGARWEKLSDALGSRYGVMLAHSGGALFFGGAFGLKVTSLPTLIHDPGVDRGSFTLTPNPSVSQASVSFSITARTRVLLRVRDVAGRMIGVYHDAMLDSGSHSINLTHALRPGAYIVELETNAQVATVIMLVVR